MCYTEIPCGHSGISRGAEPGCWHLSEGFTTLFSARSPPKNKICACDGIGRHARFRCCHLSEGFCRSIQRPTSEKTEYAPVMELVDMRDLGSRAAMRVGSSPFRRTTSEQALYRLPRLFSKVKARSCRCSSFSTAIRSAGFAVGFGCALKSWRIKSVRTFQALNSGNTT